MVREAKEEIGIDIDQLDIYPVHTLHRREGDKVYMDFFFKADKWSGEPVNMEPEKCSELIWCDMSELPEDMLGYVKGALLNSERRMLFDACGWED